MSLSNLPDDYPVARRMLTVEELESMTGMKERERRMRYTQEMVDRQDAIRKRCEAATPGPWESDGDDEEVYSEGDVSVWSKHVDDPCPEPEHGGILFNVGPPITRVGVACNREREDGRFIAHARDDVPWLLERLQQALDDATCWQERATWAEMAIYEWASEGKVEGLTQIAKELSGRVPSSGSPPK